MGLPLGAAGVAWVFYAKREPHGEVRLSRFRNEIPQNRSPQVDAAIMKRRPAIKAKGVSILETQ
jgi:hypothetical protein